MERPIQGLTEADEQIVACRIASTQ